MMLKLFNFMYFLDVNNILNCVDIRRFSDNTDRWNWIEL